jgi:hypothetical protein
LSCRINSMNGDDQTFARLRRNLVAGFFFNLQFSGASC